MTCLRGEYPNCTIDTLCELFGHTKQAWYQSNKYTYKETVEEKVIVDMCKDIRENCPGVGARKLQAMLKQNYGITCGRDRLFDMLDGAGMLLRQRHRAPRTTYSGHVMPVYPNIVGNLLPMRPNHVWVSDITYVRVENEFMYLFLITDMYSRKIVGWCLSDNMEASNAIKALKMAIAQRKDSSLPVIHHSDRGSQYCCSRYVKLLRKNHINISMTENGDPRENAYAERINGTIKNEFLKKRVLTKGNAHDVVKKDIEAYNFIRPHDSIARLTPAAAHELSGELKRMWKHYPWYHKENEKKTEDLTHESKDNSGKSINFAHTPDGEASVIRREPDIEGDIESPSISHPLPASRTDTGVSRCSI